MSNFNQEDLEEARQALADNRDHLGIQDYNDIYSVPAGDARRSC